MKKFKVYLLVNKVPYGLVDEFLTLGEAQKCKEACETFGVKDTFGQLVFPTARIIVKSL